MPESVLVYTIYNMKKSERNKTIDLTVEEGRQYLQQCMRAESLSAAAPADAAVSAALLQSITDRVILGDTFEVLSQLPPAFADLLIVDPPYNLTKDYGGEEFRKMPAEDYADFTRKWLNLVRPLLKPTASVYVCCDWRTGILLSPILEEYFTLRSRITWQREKGRGAGSNWKNGMEDIWFATVSDEYTFHVDAVRQRRKVIAPYRKDGQPKDWEETEDGNFRDTCPSNFWDDISVPYWSMAENTAHPAQKPEKLIAKLILASSSEGDIVLDPFLGSGTTAVTAKKLNRHFVGIERSEQCCVWAQKRLEMAGEDASIQGYADGVFWERNTGMLQKLARRGKKK